METETTFNNFFERGLNVLSLFDGMSCGQIALHKAGIKVAKYYASEIKEHGIRVTQHNFPDTIQLGDVRNIKVIDLPKIDLLIGGSPCQDFSRGNAVRDGLQGEKSSLFYEYFRLLKELKPTYWLLENVVMDAEQEMIISELVGTEPVRINSSLLSAQLRDRLYWTNIGQASYDLFGNRTCAIPLPKDKKIKLQDVLEDGFTDREKSRALLESDSRPLRTPTKMFHRYYSTGFTTVVFKDESIYKEMKRRYEEGLPGDAQQLNPSTESGGQQPYMQNRVYSDKGKAPCLTQFADRLMVFQKENIRYLTQTELERLQTVPDKEIICIFALCEEEVMNYVNVVEQNPKLLKLALNAEKEKLNEFAKLVNQNTKQSNQQTKHIALPNADMLIQKQTKQCTTYNHIEKNIPVGNVEDVAMFKNQKQGDIFVDSPVFINITEGKITHFGTEESHLKDNHSTRQLNGGIPLKLSIKEIMELVKDVDAGTIKNKDTNCIYTILSVLNIKNIEMMLVIYYLFAKNATIGYTQNIIKQKNISVQFKINELYTSILKRDDAACLLGDGWTIDVIAYIFSFLKGEGKKLLKVETELSNENGM